ncbi:hypothetical protein E2K93_02855 [Thalassotalea sp. HSM 43]|uniref:vanadium-dependent haloperoxidase n=1 Tax=Thalassotalea sp. HSM 43 TaxID=2552945 RepID=UPI0010810944|nr:vanadium-dependent haloperoxidase [Thalassotalea sp. HSM 43]QBY03375.1 hypothetical protein E2K93_02855 [Thalassotalea sp. HSM 43]
MNVNKITKTSLCLAIGLALTACGDSNDEADRPVLPKQSADKTHSVARQWNEVLLQGIRNDFARPTVHARNLFHVSAAMYDAWALYSDDDSYLAGKSLNNNECRIDIELQTDDSKSAQQTAISYAAYRIIQHRFELSPDAEHTFELANKLMQELGYDEDYVDTELSPNDAAALGNYIAECYIAYGFDDGAKEDILYSNIAYQVSNDALDPELPGNPNISDLNRWQSLDLGTYIDQSGNEVAGAIEFLGPEWGQVKPFSLSQDDLTIKQRDGFDYYIYHDPGMPPLVDDELADEYEWGFSLVSEWSAQLDPSDGVMIDISPASQGNITLEQYPKTFAEHRDFYQLDGGDIGQGYAQNPVTGQPYQQQMVPRGDYARVLAEFWADGPDSETPPGHWFVILNTVFDHPDFVPRFAGQGDVLDNLEWDVKAYFTLGGAMHDSAISAWGIKGWYDYIRPISAIRAMADLGQRSDNTKANYHLQGLRLQPGLVELVKDGDVLAGSEGEHVGKLKLFAWRGPTAISDASNDVAGVDWILAENWWPYQRPSFVTPPFAGYVSGHSTYSRAAAEVMTKLTGSEYFPGGMSSFAITADDFLVFEQGPSVDMTLQWATYQDASDQCSLSRIWGGIHPPADDIPGRLIGYKIGQDAFQYASQYFSQ